MPADTSEVISVQVNGDTTVELDETFTVQLFNPTNATILDSQGDGTILNDDANEPPVADPNGPYEAGEGGIVVLDGAGSFDSDGDVLGFEWIFQGESIFEALPKCPSPTTSPG